MKNTLIFEEQLSNQELETKVSKILTQMTLEEKASLCSGKDTWSTKPIERLNIPWLWMTDGPHGVRRAPETFKEGIGDQLPATCFPTSSALAASWDVDLIYQVGQVLGEECHANDVNILLGPGVNIKRSVLGGRNFEFFSEDPVLSGEIGAAYINGVQSVGIGTSLKHFATNNVETNRMYINSDVDLRTLNEIYLTPFEIAIKKANPWTVMACYNRVQGVYGTESDYLLTTILKNKWHYEGIVISDWEAVLDRVAGIKAGLHVQMPGSKISYVDSLIVDAVKNNKLEITVLDAIVKKILEIVLMSNSLKRKGAKLLVDENHNFARKVAGETITLLKNDNDILPITKEKYKTAAIIGEFATSPRYQGNGSSEVKPTQLDNALEMIKNEYGENIKIEFSQGYNLKDDDDFTLIDKAKKIAKKVDIAILFVGLPLHYEAEGIDRKHINLPAAHNKLISEITKVNKNVVVVLTNGSAVAMPWISKVQGVLETWLVGQAGAGAIADIMFGKVNPSGKLAETFPVRLEDTPAFLNFPGEEGNVLYGERIFVGYRYYDARKIEPLFPFGFGLSYTTFEYSNLKVSSKKITNEEGLTVSFQVKNSGEILGKEIVQLYVSDIECTLQRPENELKKFAKIELKPGETKTVTFKLESRDFSYFDSKRDLWIAESGSFKINVGASSRAIKLSEIIQLQSTQKVPLAIDEFTFIREVLNNKQASQYLLEIIPIWLSQFIPEGGKFEDIDIFDFKIDQPIKKLPIYSEGEVNEEQINAFVQKCKNLTYTP